MIYLDYNATTPIDKRVADAMKPFLYEHFGNPSSAHKFGQTTKIAVENARAQVANLLGVEAEEIIFTSGGTESNKYAIKGYAFANREKGNHIITSIVEHPAVIEVCKFLARNGFEITYLDVDENGKISLDSLCKSIRSTTIMITIMHANNEVGTIQPITEIAKIANENKIVFHTDASQSIGKVPTKISELNVDLMTIAGHKIYAPKGIGALYLKKGITLEKFMHGANHESGYRAGTENVLEIVGLGKACELIAQENDNEKQRFLNLKQIMIDIIQENNLEFRINGHKEDLLPNTLSISFKNIQAQEIIKKLDDVALSAGSACHSGSTKISSVLAAMKIPFNYALGTLRISLGRFTTESEVIYAAKRIVAIVKSYR